MGSRSGNFLQATHQPGHVWSDRAYFSPADEPALLMIGDMEAADAVLYVCSASLDTGNTRNTTVQFVVVGEFYSRGCYGLFPPLEMT
ncbi:hypothetical protein IscW_ISCW014302 [Ixodes scapularis]|uniref:Uncharacterized protein n=1 Tax=Ixodes scapularis TaxID=6945 RepID=B7QIE3_IXOSC|nr:hypothetical protein IscW_ISCW014302 [Ixodes scapularis]|eukprot:XP_002414950.1 hypothetical protein IscW_ISCW014302 [Ixodes scapularis]